MVFPACFTVGVSCPAIWRALVRQSANGAPCRQTGTSWHASPRAPQPPNSALTSACPLKGLEVEGFHAKYRGGPLRNSIPCPSPVSPGGRGGRAMQMSTPLLYRGLSQPPPAPFLAGRRNKMNLVLRKCLLHMTVMGALLAVGTTEGECGV